MKDEPEIIKQLKEEEKLGILYSKVQSAYEELDMFKKPSGDVPDTTVGFIEDDVERKPAGNTSSYEYKKKSFWKDAEFYKKIFELSPEAIVVIDKKILPYGLDFIAKMQVEEKLKKKIDELERYERLTVGRELKMAELKKENKVLKEKVKKLEATLKERGR